MRIINGTSQLVRFATVLLFLACAGCERPPPPLEIVGLGAKVNAVRSERLPISVNVWLDADAFFRVKNLAAERVRLTKIDFRLSMAYSDWDVIGVPKAPMELNGNQSVTVGMHMVLKKGGPYYSPGVKWAENPDAAPSGIFDPRFSLIAKGLMNGKEVISAFTSNEAYPRLFEEPHVDVWLE